MVKGQQIKIKTPVIEKRNHDAPFGLISISLFTSQILARLKLQRKKSNVFHLGRKEILYFRKSFI